ncbi:hypothetical protein FQN54_007931 [Arachnomyces sp. PD_36]|nr:hypothetical protein FQN54_007931 [Arachnomyces sp. PD_36]
MDITRQSFYYLLPRILNELADCQFVSLDLELSGISLKPNQGRATQAPSAKQTLQLRYEEVKEAAERYQVLQIGLTLVTENPKTGVYTLKPYNLHLNPVLDQRLGLERKWMYQSGAVDFLMSNGFRMEAPYTDGLPYLSRQEEAQVKIDLIERNNFSSIISDIDVKDTDAESLDFLQAVRRDIDEWLALGDGENYLNIPKPSYINSSDTDKDNPTTINNFQKRLIHQLVRAEYPYLVSIGKSTFMQIIRYNEERENGVKLERGKRIQEKVSKQIGFRWIVEGMVGGDLRHLDPKIFESVMPSSKEIEAECALQAYSLELEARLKKNRPALVGHNIFTDLVNLYGCFFGKLPDRVEDFQTAISKLFPLIVDTKYMATHNCGSINPKSSLEEINESLKGRPKPVIDPQHGKYLNTKPLHEAGYDSLLTAQILIKLSAQLRSDPRKPTTNAVDPNLAAFSTVYKQALHNGIGEAEAGDTRKIRNDSIDSLIEFPPARKDSTGSSTTLPKRCPTQKSVDWAEPTEVTRIRSAFAHKTRFDLLTDQTQEVLTFPPKDGGNGGTTSAEESLLSFPDDIDVDKKVSGGDLIPRFGSDFWAVYGNKLRVFGTEEGVCVLGT